MLTSATATAWERTPWHATERAAWEAVKRAVVKPRPEKNEPP